MTTFTTWLRVRRRRYWKEITAILTGSLVSALLKLVPHLSLDGGTLVWLPLAISIVQGLVVFGLFWWARPTAAGARSPDALADDPGLATARGAARQFDADWRLIWAAWVAFYLGLSLNYLTKLVDHPSPAVGQVTIVVNNFFQNLASVFFLFCFLDLNQRTVDDDGRPLDSPVRQKVPGTLFAYTAAEVAVYAGCRALELNDAGIAHVQLVFRLVCGAAAGICMALFFGRLTTPLMPAPVWLTPILYGYAVLQVSYAFFKEDGDAVETVIIVVVLPLKCLLFMYVAWLQQTGMLFYYLFRMRVILGEEDEGRRRFFLLHPPEEARPGDSGEAGEDPAGRGASAPG